MVNMERGQGSKVIISKDIREEVNVHKKPGILVQSRIKIR
jgi:hypothetical protein